LAVIKVNVVFVLCRIMNWKISCPMGLQSIMQEWHE